jgi:hypothetical protein
MNEYNTHRNEENLTYASNLYKTQYLPEIHNLRMLKYNVMEMIVPTSGNEIEPIRALYQKAMNLVEFDMLEGEPPSVLKFTVGNKVKPSNAAKPVSPKTSSDKTAIIVPFRDDTSDKLRTKQLDIFTKFFETYLQGIPYEIFVIEQSFDKMKFNRGALLNIGFKQALIAGCTNFIFHDVDLLPSVELKQYYMHAPTDEPVHIAAVWDRYGRNQDYFGGIVAFNQEMFQNINGYPNNFWGWGGEDDELYKRTKEFYSILKVNKGSVQDLENLSLQEKLDFLKENDLKFMKKREALAAHEATWKINGLNSINYTVRENSECGLNCVKMQVGLPFEKNRWDEDEDDYYD